MSSASNKIIQAAAGNAGAEDPEFIVWWHNGLPDVRDGTDPSQSANITLTVDPTSEGVPTFATSAEQVNWAPGTPYICFGSFDQRQNYSSGSVIDFSDRENWVLYGNYPFNYSSNGGSYQEMGIANNNGHVIFNRPIDSECRIFDIDTYNYRQGLNFANSMRFDAATNYLYMDDGTSIDVYNWSGTTASLLYVFSGSISASDIALSPDGNYIAVGKDNNVRIFDNRSSSGALTLAYNVDSIASSQSPSIAGFIDIRRIEFSPDSSKLLVTGDGGSYVSTGGFVMVFDLDTSTAHAMSTPAGSTNDKINGCAWFPDNDRYAVGGYSGAKSHIGSFSSGGYLSEYGLFNAQGGVVVIPFEDE